MARMSREFSLVLLGTGALTAGYFLYPEPDLEAAQNKQLQQEVAENGGVANNSPNSRHYGSHTSFIWLHSGFGYGYGSAGRSLSSASGAVRAGGFGAMGHAAAGG